MPIEYVFGRKMSDNQNLRKKKKYETGSIPREESAPLRHIPRVAALHDMSSFGRCALTVVIPTLSAMGVQCVPVPTALLSTHTGGFSDMYFRDLDSVGAVDGIGEHFRELRLDMDAVYTGFLGSDRQVATVKKFISDVTSGSGRKPLVFVDPVMADDGVMYSACSPELVDSMRDLIRVADVITPNVTEACLLAGVTYRDTSGLSRKEAEKFAADLEGRISCITDAAVVITGILCEMVPDGDPAPAGFGESNGFDSCTGFSGLVGTYAAGKLHVQRSVGREYPGTGDIFSSVLLGDLLSHEKLRRSGRDPAAILSALPHAAAAASEFTSYTISYSVKYGSGEPARDGVLLEGCLDRLIPKKHE